MRVDITEQEKTFFSLSVGLSTYISNVLADYEQKIQVLVEQINKLTEENKKLKEEKQDCKDEKECEDKDCKS